MPHRAAAIGCVLMPVLASVVLGIGPAAPPAAAAPAVLGLDVSGHQPGIDWSKVEADGAQFAYVKATEGNGYVNPDFTAQYDGSYGAGLIRGAYHFALPDVSSGSVQASYFVANGGSWTDDGRTLPGALDIEANPRGATCYGLSQTAMVSWIASFADGYHSLTSRWPVIYTAAGWWTKCTGGYAGFASQDPLWTPDYFGTPGSLPGGWGSYAFWQSADHGTFPGDQDVFDGSRSDLLTLVAGG